jgi:hypothetical protein
LAMPRRLSPRSLPSRFARAAFYWLRCTIRNAGAPSTPLRTASRIGFAALRRDAHLIARGIGSRSLADRPSGLWNSPVKQPADIAVSPRSEARPQAKRRRSRWPRR